MRKSHVAGLIVTCALVAVIVHEWPGIRRYLTMKRM
ncbi:DUF6893 family small protein [Nonomuraea indica]|uniref:DUF6893 family small protein n=1 Tax=Nonomuraea indica TaxID=1581193 RepID=A0ABW7ZYJ6_9ACTN